MFGYYFVLAIRSFKRNKILTALMVSAIAFGIGASITMLTVLHVLSGDPIPGKSDQLFYPQLDSAGMIDYAPGDEPYPLLTRLDAETLLRERRGDRQALMAQGEVGIQSESLGVMPSLAIARYTSADFFAMFATPFRYGGGWNADDDERRARVAVISQELNNTLFGGRDSVGKTFNLEGIDFRILGVIGDWRPMPRFYDVVSDGALSALEGVFLPYSTSRELRLYVKGRIPCWDGVNTDGPEGPYALNAHCAWLSYWVELDTPAKVEAYRRYLVNYSDQQRAAGRYQRPTNVRLNDVMTWLEVNKVVPSDARLQTWLAFGFLLVCLVNTVGLLLAKFLRRSGEIGVRRALGASRGAIFMQCLVEAATVGLAGGVLGLGLAWLGLQLVRQSTVDYPDLLALDPAMLLTTFALAIASSLLAGLLPAWRAMRVQPALQLKSQ
ncbi:MAG: ABC transporter permease [Luteimonas sp.]